LCNVAITEKIFKVRFGKDSDESGVSSRDMSERKQEAGARLREEVGRKRCSRRRSEPVPRARGKRRGFSPGAAARHSSSARAHTDCHFVFFFFTFFCFVFVSSNLIFEVSRNFPQHLLMSLPRKKGEKRPVKLEKEKKVKK